MYNNDNFNNDFNNDFSSGGQFMNEQYFQLQDALAKNSFEVGKRLKKIFWLLISVLIGVAVWLVAFVIACSSLVSAYITGGIKNMNYKTYTNLPGMEFILVLSIFLLIGALVFLILYLVFLYELKPYEADFGTAAMLVIIGIPVGIVGACFPAPISYIVKIGTSALQIASTYYFLNGIYNSVRKVDVNRATVVGNLRNVVVGFSVASAILSFLSSLDTSGFLSIIYLLVSLVSFGVTIWEYVEIWRSASFLQRYGEANMPISNATY